jgi:hypothetical protein
MPDIRSSVKFNGIAATGLNAWFNVKDKAYGAKGDGTTDDTAAVQACINACSAAGGGSVYAPPGSYLINGSSGVGLTVPAGVQLICDIDTFSYSAPTSPVNFICGSNSLTSFFTMTGNNSSLQGFSVTAANSGCVVPVILCNNVARQYYGNLYASGLGGIYGDGLNRSRLENVLVVTNTGYGHYLPNNTLTYVNDGNAGPAATQTFGGLTGVTLSTALTNGATVTTLAVTALSAALTAGQVLTVGALNGTIQTAVVSANAAINATSVSVVSFVANATYAIGSVVQQITAGYVLSGATFKMNNQNSSAGWGYPKFMYNVNNSVFTDTESNESGSNGQDALYLNNVTATNFFGFNNNTGSFNGYQANISNGSKQLSFFGGTFGGGVSGIVLIDGTVTACNDINITGMNLRSQPSASVDCIQVTGAVQRLSITGNTFYGNSCTGALLNDGSTTTSRGTVFSGNAITNYSGSQPYVLAAYTAGYVNTSGNTGVTDILPGTDITLTTDLTSQTATSFTQVGSFAFNNISKGTYEIYAYIPTLATSVATGGVGGPTIGFTIANTGSHSGGATGEYRATGSSPVSAHGADNATFTSPLLTASSLMICEIHATTVMTATGSIILKYIQTPGTGSTGSNASTFYAGTMMTIRRVA